MYNVNWNDIEVFSKSGINWADVNILTTSKINWNDIGVVTNTGINWTDLDTMSDTGINWTDIDRMSDAGTEWNKVFVVMDAQSTGSGVYTLHAHLEQNGTRKRLGSYISGSFSLYTSLIAIGSAVDLCNGGNCLGVSFTGVTTSGSLDDTVAYEYFSPSTD